MGGYKRCPFGAATVCLFAKNMESSMHHSRFVLSINFLRDKNRPPSVNRSSETSAAGNWIFYSIACAVSETDTFK
jgi:hypothetical protein